MSGGFSAAKEAFEKRAKAEQQGEKAEPTARIKQIAGMFDQDIGNNKNGKVEAFADFGHQKTAGPSVAQRANLFLKEQEEKKNEEPEKTAKDRFADAAKRFNTGS